MHVLYKLKFIRSSYFLAIIFD